MTGIILLIISAAAWLAIGLRVAFLMKRPDRAVYYPRWFLDACDVAMRAGAYESTSRRVASSRAVFIGNAGHAPRLPAFETWLASKVHGSERSAAAARWDQEFRWDIAVPRLAPERVRKNKSNSF